jgi:hypothetical protein
MTDTEDSSLVRATLSIFGAERQLGGASRIINCLRALGPSLEQSFTACYDLAERS